MTGVAAGADVRLRRNQPAYPPLLAAIHDPPAQLYVRGSTRGLPPGPTVAIVGARACSAYGAHVAKQLGCELAKAGVVVVSGLARGIDGEAHRGALTGGGPTVAVLGGGLDRIYPSAHSKLARQITQQGALVSEYALGTVPAPWRFPARNRIMAGLSQAVVVVEAGAKSGALITADLALEEGREVLAVPGEITSSLSAGTNALLQQGAAPLTCPQDVLDLLGLDRPQAAEPPTLRPLEAALLEALAAQPLGADELSRLLDRPIEAVAAALVELELEGRVHEASGTYRVSLSG